VSPAIEAALSEHLEATHEKVVNVAAAIAAPIEVMVSNCRHQMKTITV
jgi:hypothetical protein